ncbi:unnamed protein product [Gulo gulo]|uniref:Uncharacterized protein n=1 Tax=Gulo gulo TaxID=48420 RepID=A0A9X9LGH6_GULGU|nr:unnamed protein product [Gulo gulo]
MSIPGRIQFQIAAFLSSFSTLRSGHIDWKSFICLNLEWS